VNKICENFSKTVLVSLSFRVYIPFTLARENFSQSLTCIQPSVTESGLLFSLLHVKHLFCSSWPFAFQKFPFTSLEFCHVCTQTRLFVNIFNHPNPFYLCRAYVPFTRNIKYDEIKINSHTNWSKIISDVFWECSFRISFSCFKRG
jgi:hypothetical protein